MRASLKLLALVAVAASARADPKYKKLTNFVTFGDSWTDEGRLGYFINNNGQAPPAGTLLPESNNTASGGYSWGRLVAKATGANYYNYAVSGATCSNKVVERDFSYIGQPFPSVLEYEIPAFQADTAYRTLYPNRRGDNTVYALWIGTNDLGGDAFLTDSNAPGTTLTSFLECVWRVFDNIYQTGGRQFVLLNAAPLDQIPLYLSPENGGVPASSFWAGKATVSNATEYQYKMLEYTTSVNTMFDYGAPFHVEVKNRWRGADFTIFDVHSLFRDILGHPRRYLTAPANVTGVYCTPVAGSSCQRSSLPLSSFLWFDELHPSERAHEVVAEEFVEVIRGNSVYATTYKS